MGRARDFFFKMKNAKTVFSGLSSITFKTKCSLGVDTNKRVPSSFHINKDYQCGISVAVRGGACAKKYFETVFIKCGMSVWNHSVL